jgi:hypothetical protein
MILVDTSVWIDHLHRTEPRLVEELEAGAVGCHELVIEELALGNLKNRSAVLGLFAELSGFPRLTHAEVIAFVESNQLWSQWLSVVDAHLLGSVTISAGGRLWTRDKRMRAVATRLGIASVLQ